tara:strand:- start:1870 stop:2547 length:678 start_codon:yes stop_codon:yes gene_type:complete
METQILELQDQITAKQTEQADAVALLGDAELVLEHKITYIMELDRSLNLRIRELEAECDRKTEEIDRRGNSLLAAKQLELKNREERDTTVVDLSGRIESANQEINQAHSLAREIDLKRAESVEELDQKSIELESTATVLHETKTALASATASIQELRKSIQESGSVLAATKVLITSLEDEATRKNAELNSTEQTTRALKRELSDIRTSLIWRMSRPWRALFGPKS